MKDFINYNDFKKLDIRVGTIIDVKVNNMLIKPSMILKIDFGNDIGIKKSSAQLTKNYNSEKLMFKQIIAILNFQPKQIGNLISDVLVLGLPDDNNEPVLISPDKKISNGGKLY